MNVRKPMSVGCWALTSLAATPALSQIPPAYHNQQFFAVAPIPREGDHRVAHIFLVACAFTPKPHAHYPVAVRGALP